MMDNKEFMEKCLRWQELQLEAATIAAELEAETVERGKTQNFGDVRVTYSQPCGKNNPEAAARALLTETDLDIAMEDFQVVSVSINWNAICKAYELDLAPFYEPGTGAPTAKIKLLK